MACLIDSVTRDKNFVCVLFTAFINDVASMFLLRLRGYYSRFGIFVIKFESLIYTA